MLWLISLLCFSSWYNILSLHSERCQFLFRGSRCQLRLRQLRQTDFFPPWSVRDHLEGMAQVPLYLRIGSLYSVSEVSRLETQQNSCLFSQQFCFWPLLWSQVGNQVTESARLASPPKTPNCPNCQWSLQRGWVDAPNKRLEVFLVVSSLKCLVQPDEPCILNDWFHVEEQGVSFFKDIENNNLNSLQTTFQRATLPTYSLTFKYFSSFTAVLGLGGGATWLKKFPWASALFFQDDSRAAAGAPPASATDTWSELG